jgi:hypothetical protein
MLADPHFGTVVQQQRKTSGMTPQNSYSICKSFVY